ncbi:Uncharacterised protein [Vibrio cholerae]|nr:Uncharacterised protein [Vibrio cholerae]
MALWWCKSKPKRRARVTTYQQANNLPLRKLSQVFSLSALQVIFQAVPILSLSLKC